MQRQRRVMLAAAVIGGAMVAGGCAADPDDSMRAAETSTTQALVTVPPPMEEFPANGERVDVLAIDNIFNPAALTVVAGTEVVFTNNGRNDHNVIPDDDPTAASWGVLDSQFLPGDTYSHVFTRPGTYLYVCTIHGTATFGMFGTIVVTEP